MDLSAIKAEKRATSKKPTFQSTFKIYIANIREFFTNEWSIDEDMGEQKFITDRCGGKLMKQKDVVWATEHGAKLLAGVAPR
jgi:hypothetical protein